MRQIHGAVNVGLQREALFSASLIPYLRTSQSIGLATLGREICFIHAALIYGLIHEARHEQFL